MTLQEIQYKAQSIISKWRDDDSAPYIELVEELAHMIVPEPSEDLKEAVKNYIYKAADSPGDVWTTDDIRNAYIAGYKHHADHTPLPEDTVLFQKGVEEGKRLMMEEAVPFYEILKVVPPGPERDKVKIIIVKEDEK